MASNPIRRKRTDMTIDEQLKLLYEIKEETLIQLNTFICEWYEDACWNKLKNLEKRIKELEELRNENSERDV